MNTVKIKQNCYKMILGLGMLLPAWGQAQTAQPNIILIMADDLGYGELSCYGSKTVHTPHLDQLAADGIRFTDFHANGPVCSPTRAALMTGKYQQRTGVEGVITAADHREVGLSLEEDTMAEVLSNAGYQCGMYGKWHLGYGSEYNPTFQGFDQFAGFVSGNIDYHSHIDQAGYLDWWQGKEIKDEPGYTTDLITSYGQQFIIDNHPKKTGKPFFLYLAQEAPHYPIQGRNDAPLRMEGSGDFVRKVPNDSVASIYTEMIETMDEGIGELMKTLAEEGLLENTIVVFCSDNGAAGGRGDNGPLRASKASIYEGGHRVPAIVYYPGKIAAGTVSEETVLTMDLLPTFVDLAGGGTQNLHSDGISLKDHFLTGNAISSRDVFWRFKGKAAVRTGEWKLVVNQKEGDKKAELYNLSTDLSESKDLASRHPEIVVDMLHKLQSWEKDVSAGVEIISE